MCKVVPALCLALVATTSLGAEEKAGSCCKSPGSRAALLTSAPSGTAGKPAAPVAPAPTPAAATAPAPSMLQRVLAFFGQAAK